MVRPSFVLLYPMLLVWAADDSSSCRSLVQLGKATAPLKEKDRSNVGACVPGAGKVWLWEVFHKTGTVLSIDMLKNISMTIGRREYDWVWADFWEYEESLYPFADCDENTFSTPCMASVYNTSLRTVLKTGLAIPDAQTRKERLCNLKKDLQTRQEEDEIQVALISWVRDPLQIVKSAYVYHAETCDCDDEPWLCETPSSHVSNLFASCDDADNGLSVSVPNGYKDAVPLPVPAAEACSAARQAISMPLRNRTSYRQLLQNVTAQIGSLVESWRSFPELQQMAEHYELYQDLPASTASVFFLDDVMEDCTHGFTDLWNNLGVGPDALDTCVQLGCDMISEGETSSHASTSDHALDLKAEVGDYVPSTAWFALHVQPLRVKMGLN